VNNTTFINQFSENIKFNYTCFDRVIIRGYILKFFSTACVVLFLKGHGIFQKTNGVMRIFTDQLNSHISKQAKKLGTQIYWWPSIGGVNGAKLKICRNQLGQSIQRRWKSYILHFN